MSSSDFDLLKTVFTYAWPIVIGISTYLWKLQNEKIESIKKAAKEEADDIKAEMERQRDNIAKLFDADTAIRSEAEKRHIEIMRDINNMVRK
jgi:hypothetical protein